MDLWTWVFIIVGAAVAFGVLQAIGEGSLKKKLDSALSEIDGFRPRYKLFSKDGSTGIGIDEDNKKFALLSQKRSLSIHPFSDLLAAELIQDGQSLTKTSRSSQAANAIIGGLLLGGVGAVVGALSSTQKTSSKVKRVDIRLTINDTANPIFDINFQNDEAKEGGIIHKAAMEIANEWLARFKVIMKQVDLEDSKSAPQAPPPPVSTSTGPAPTENIADQLTKLADLKERGILTREEFDAQKAKLLS